eukprot:363200-Chlamydomonas_euryale.AAC.11
MHAEGCFDGPSIGEVRSLVDEVDLERDGAAARATSAHKDAQRSAAAGGLARSWTRQNPASPFCRPRGPCWSARRSLEGAPVETQASAARASRTQFSGQPRTSSRTSCAPAEVSRAVLALLALLKPGRSWGRTTAARVRAGVADGPVAGFGAVASIDWAVQTALSQPQGSSAVRSGTPDPERADRGLLVEDPNPGRRARAPPPPYARARASVGSAGL